MSMVYTDEQQLLRESAREFLRRKANPQAFRALRDANPAGKMDPETWSQMVDLGWAGMVVPEAFGGLEFGYSGVGLLLEEMGRNLSKSPFFETAVLGVTALVSGGNLQQKRDYLTAIAEGRLNCALAIDEGPIHRPDAIALTATPDGDSYLLNGNKTFVRNGLSAWLLIVAARVAQAEQGIGISLFLVEAGQEGVHIQDMDMADTGNTARIGFSGVRVPASQVLGTIGQGDAVLTRILDTANICLAAEMLGIARECFERTVAYLKKRQQFGRLIGSFQALQHRAAHMHCELELAASVVMKALQTLDVPETPASTRSALASLAKAKLCKVIRLVTNEAIQMHGGIGMTDEFDIGFYVKRARVAACLFGDYSYHAERYAALNGY